MERIHSPDVQMESIVLIIISISSPHVEFPANIEAAVC
jgi:hypothetical protein